MDSKRVKKVAIVEVPVAAPRRRATKYKSTYEYNKRPPGFLSAGGSAAGGALGTALGGPAGTAIGSFIGGKLGHLVEKITGFGDYHIEQNSLMGGGMSAAQIVNSSDRGGVIVRHREYIGDIFATSAFTVTKYPINPGQASTFPWLSQGDGKAYDQWRPRGMIFEFVSTSSDAVLSGTASSALGSVIMATDYDALDDPYPNKRAMLNSEFASSSKPSCDFIHPVECKMAVTPTKLLYTRASLGYPVGGDPRLFDLGNFYVATEGMQNAATGQVVGQLFLIYEIEFFKPQISPVDALTDHWGLSNMTAAARLGTVSSNLAIGGTIGGVVNGPGDTYSFPSSVTSGKFMFVYGCVGTAIAIGAPNTISVVNGALIDYWNTGATVVSQSPAAGVSSVTVTTCFIVNVTSANCTVTFGNSAIPTGTNAGDLWIMQISSTITG